MSATIDWYIEDRVILIKVTHWTVVSLREDTERVAEMLQSSGWPLVHTLWDFSELVEYPKDVQKIAGATNRLLKSPALGWIITVTDHAMIKFLTHITTNLYRVRHRNIDTMDQAIAFLKSVDESLKELST